jgi:hypothetical protein
MKNHATAGNGPAKRLRIPQVSRDYFNFDFPYLTPGPNQGTHVMSSLNQRAGHMPPDEAGCARDQGLHKDGFRISDVRFPVIRAPLPNMAAVRGSPEIRNPKSEILLT